MTTQVQFPPARPGPEFPVVPQPPRGPWPEEVPEWQEPDFEPGHDPLPPGAPPEVEPLPPDLRGQCGRNG
jgi:hypothetical protein